MSRFIEPGVRFEVGRTQSGERGFVFALVAPDWGRGELEAIHSGPVTWHFLMPGLVYVTAVMVQAGTMPWQRAFFSLGKLDSQSEFPQRLSLPGQPGHNGYPVTIAMMDTRGRTLAHRAQFWTTSASNDFDLLMSGQRKHLGSWTEEKALAEIEVVRDARPEPTYSDDELSLLFLMGPDYGP